MDLNIDSTISELQSALDSFRKQADSADQTGRLIIETLRKGNKILSCGNGGSASDALHLAEELVGRFRGDRPSLAGISLAADVTALTCIANDYGYDAVFSRQVLGIGKAGDILIGFTTSGNSENIVKAFEAARTRAITTILLAGETGGRCKALADHAILVPCKNGARIQEIHTLILHHWLELVEQQSWNSEIGTLNIEP